MNQSALLDAANRAAESLSKNHDPRVVDCRINRLVNVWVRQEVK